MIVGDREAIYKAIEVVLKNELGDWGVSAVGNEIPEFVIERFEEAVIHRITDAVIATGTEDHG